LPHFDADNGGDVTPEDASRSPTADFRDHPLVRVAISRRRLLAGAGFFGATLLLGPIATARRLAKGADALTRAQSRAPGALRIPAERVVPDAGARSAQPVMEPTYRATLAAKIGSMLLLGFDGTAVGPDSAVVRAIRDNFLGGVVIFDAYANGRVRNVASPDQLRTLTASLQAASPGGPIIVAVDEEGGNVARLNGRRGFPGTYTAATLGSIGDPNFTQTQGAAIGQTLAAAGINLNLAPVVDINLNARNVAIGGQGRTFSSSAETVALHASAFAAGVRSSGVAVTLKHFPGQGSAGGDTHLGAVDVTGSWSREELRPFIDLIGRGVADAVLTGHIFNRSLDAGYPASLSPATVDGLLRGEIGYEGVVISDDLSMGAIQTSYRLEDAVVLAVEAGIDVLTIGYPTAVADMPRIVDALTGAVQSGRISEERIDASYERIRTLRSRLLS
jgi:beta-N-acetylhexosaminidase